VPDVKRAGCADDADFDTRFAAGHLALIRTLWSAKPDGFDLVINDGGATPALEAPFLTGNMREGWPYQGGGSWLTHYNGLIADAKRGMRECWINAVPPTCLNGNPWPFGGGGMNQQRARFGLGTAYLTGARFSFTTNERPATDERWARWLPEYDLDLGAPLAPARRSSLGIYIREHERGTVLVDPARQDAAFTMRA
jgi:hypothetical protein